MNQADICSIRIFDKTAWQVAMANENDAANTVSRAVFDKY